MAMMIYKKFEEIVGVSNGQVTTLVVRQRLSLWQEIRKVKKAKGGEGRATDLTFHRYLATVIVHLVIVIPSTLIRVLW